MPFRIAVIPGDGIGPEVIAQGLRVLDAVTAATGTHLDRVMYDLGAERYLRTGEILPDAVFKELQIRGSTIRSTQPGCCSGFASNWISGSTCGPLACSRPG